MSQTREVGRLAEAQDRMVLLQRLVDEMNLDERRAVTAMISKRNDPMAILAVELIIEILDHLPIFAAWRLQLVGRRWRSFLSSEIVLRAGLARWDCHHDSDSASDPLQTASEAIRSKVRRIQALRLGCPFSKIRLRWELSSNHRSSSKVIALKGRRIAFIERGNSLCVRELVTGGTISIQGEAREMIHSLTLGSDAVAFATHSGKLYVQDLSDRSGPPRCVRLPSAAVLAMHMDNEYVGLLLNCGSSVALYNSKTGSLRCFDVGFDSTSGRQASLLVNSHGGTIDVFNYTQTKLDDGVVFPYQRESPEVDCIVNMVWRHARYSFQGDQIATSRIELPQQHLPRPPQFSWRTSRQAETDYCTPSASGYAGIYNIGNAVMWPFCHASDLPTIWDKECDSLDNQIPCQIHFDSQKIALRLECIKGLGETFGDDCHQEYEATAWKDVQFITQIWQSDDGVLETRNLVEGTSRFRSQTDIHGGNWKAHSVVGVNDSFLATMGIQRDQPNVGEIAVRCFDESLECAGFESTKIWGSGGCGRFNTERSSDPEGHLEPLCEYK